MNCAEMAGDNQGNLHIKYLTLNADFSNPGRNSLGSRRSAHAGVKVVILPLLARVSVKTVADRHIHAAYYNKRWSRAF